MTLLLGIGCWVEDKSRREEGGSKSTLPNNCATSAEPQSESQIFWLVAAFYPSPLLLRLERSRLLCFQGLTTISNVFELRLGAYSPKPPGAGLLASSRCDIDAKSTVVQWYGGTKLRRTEPVALVYLGGAQVFCRAGICEMS